MNLFRILFWKVSDEPAILPLLLDASLVCMLANLHYESQTLEQVGVACAVLGGLGYFARIIHTISKL